MPREDLPVLPFDTFGPKLDELLQYTSNKLEREWPAGVSTHRYSGPMLLSLVLVSANTYRTMLYFCVDKPVNDKPKPEYSLSAAPLARTILDALFNVVFVLEDLSARTEWFHKAGWREVADELERARKAHGSNPRWKPYIEAMEDFTERTKLEFSITDEEAANVSSIQRWPIPSRMIPKTTNPDVRAFMEYLQDWFYRELSQDSHLSFRGLARRAGYLLLNRQPEQKDWDIHKQKSDVLGITVVLLLSIMSEIELRFRFGAAERLKFIWGVLNPYFQQSQEIYDLRYANAL